MYKKINQLNTPPTAAPAKTKYHLFAVLALGTLMHVPALAI